MNTKQYNQQYYLKNRDRIKARQQERAEEIAEYQKKYRQENYTRIRYLIREWHREQGWLGGRGMYDGRINYATSDK